MRKKILKYARILIYVFLSLPKTIYFNIVTFPLRQAIFLPVFIGWHIKILETHKGIIILPQQISPFMIKIGFGGSPGVPENSRGSICLEKGQVSFCGRAVFAKGCSLRLNGHLIFGENFSANKNCFISCTENICFGKNVLLGWNVNIRDSDGHSVYFQNRKKTQQKAIIIGDHVWICSETHILKGSGIGNDSVIGYKSLLTKRFDENNVLVVGHPAMIAQREINWKN